MRARLPFPVTRKLCCRGLGDRKRRWRQEEPRSKSARTIETLQHYRGFSSLSPRSRFAFSLRTVRMEFLAWDGAERCGAQGLGTGVHVRPPSAVGKLFVVRAVQIVAWSAAMARTP